ncbi:NAD(P)H-binding protein [Zunongwangia sp. HRR-M8]|uniref:NAD(P)H-binding protein n=1 Tax=Zunongwangia sp. HRR-M8 TaxID=3015170 RepID=UPI0022DE49B0|nr:NAD(P)H-binding protein [Zunongwangia sp. HRR-M8]WBL22556.1 NAD(P)H-binding protein [Zunongwangia sp. HRR-M8]
MQISILGCGWLGLPLAKKLVEDGYSLKGSTTTQVKMKKLSDAGITPYHLELYENGVQGDIQSFLSGSEILLIDIPPGLRKNPEINFTSKITNIISNIEYSGIQKVIFVSSTSVFEDQDNFPEYTEESKTNGTSKAAKQLIDCENALRNNQNFSTSVIRFGGLISQDRHPVTMLSGRSGIKNGAAPANLIQRDDCIALISQIIKNDEFGIVFNAAYPEHPKKAHYYTKEAHSRNIKAPEYDQNQSSKGKIISSVNLEKIGFEFEHEI